MENNTFTPPITSDRTSLFFRKYFPHLICAPSVFYIGILFIFPASYLFYLSINKIGEMGGTKFVGFANYFDLLTDSRFLPYLAHTFIYLFFTVYGGFVIQIIIALALTKKIKFGRFLKALILLPWAVPAVVSALSWKWIFDADYGLLNDVLRLFGIQPIFWLGKQWTALGAIIIADFWTYSPFVIITLIAGLKAIPSDYYEAAEIDGANSIRRFWHITLPLLRPVLLVLAIVRSLFAFRALDYVFVLTGGGPGNGTQVLSSWLYNEAFDYLNISYAATIGVVMVITSTLLVISLYYFFKPRYNVY